MKKIYSLLVFLGLFFGYTHGQITGNGHSSATSTAYTNGSPNDQIYIYCSPDAAGNPTTGSLTATSPSGAAPFTFQWYSYNSVTNGWDPYTNTNGVSSTVNGLGNGGYLVSITDNGGNRIGCYRAWVFINETTVDAGAAIASCGPFNLNGTASPVANFVYYNPPPNPLTIDNTTNIQVCFNANHTYVSDLGFFLVGPASCGSPTISLSPNPGAIGQGSVCNSGNNVNNLCFSSTSANILNVCTAGTPLTGTYGGYGAGAGTMIDWSALYGCDAASGGWSVQIYDCIGADVGALTGASISFNGQGTCGPLNVNYNSGAINSAINDNSCSPGSASIFSVPQNPSTTTPITLTNTITSVSWSTGAGTLSTTVNPAPANDTWYYLTVTDNFGCTAVDSVLYTNTCTCNFTSISTFTGACDPSNTFDLDVEVEFEYPPSTGNIEIVDCSGVIYSAPAPFTSPLSVTLTLPADGSLCDITVRFTDDAACNITIPAIQYPQPCACDAEIGTYTSTITGISTTDYVLCYGDLFTITPNGDYTPPGEALNPPNASGYDPNIGWLIYSCPPTVAVTPDPVLFITDDPCLVGIASIEDLNEINDQFWMDNYPGVFTDNTVYFVPITMYNVSVSPLLVSYTNTSVPCYDMGTPFAVQYLPEIVANPIEDCQAGTVTVTVSGGLPAVNGSNFTASNLSPASASFDNTTAANGGTITVSGLVDGDNYSFDITDANGCPITITGTFVGPEDATFSYGGPYCQDDPNPSPTITGVAGGQFSSTPGLSINATTGVINLGASTPGNYTITYQSPDPVCFSIETFDITINPLPIIAVNNETICVGETAVLTASGADTYTWTPATGLNTTTGATVESSATTTITYTVTGEITATGCTNTADATVTVNPLPTVNAGADFAVCDGQTVTLTATGNAATYVWDNGVTNGVGFVPGSTQTYEVTGTSAAGCVNTDDITVTVNPLPVVDAGDDFAVCIGSTITLSGSGANTYVWNNGVTDGVAFDIFGTTTYQVTGTDANGCVNTDEITVTVNANAPIDAGVDQTICSGESATITASGGVTYTWDNGLGAGASHVVSPTVTTIYTVEGVDVNGCLGTDDVTITVNPLPTATVTGTSTVCLGDAEPVITFTGANGTAPYTFTYNIDGGASQTVSSVGASTTATITIPTTTAGDFDVNLTQVADASSTVCSQAQAGTATITVNELPTASILGDVELCQNDTGPVITFTGANGTAPYTFTYTINGGANQTVSTTGGNSSVTVTASTAAAGTFTYDLVNVQEGSVLGCTQAQTGSVDVIVNPLPTATVTGTTAVCVGDAAPTVTFTGANGTAPYTFTYNVNGGTPQTVSSVGASTTATITVPTGTAGVFNVNLTQVEDASLTTCSQGQTGTAVITVNSNPVVAISGSSEYCAGTSATVDAGAGFSVYNWSTGASTQTTNVTEADNPITVEVTNAAGCTTTSAPFNVIENSIITANFTEEICFGESILIHGNLESTSGLYSQTFSTASGCDSVSNVTLIVHDLPLVNAGTDFAICPGTSVTLSGSGAVTYSWDNGVANGVPFTPITTQTYTVTGTDANGCVNTDAIEVTVNPLPTATIAGDVTVCLNEANQPEVTFTGADGTAPYTFTYTINGGANQTVNTTAGSSTVTVAAPTTTSGTFTYDLVSVQEGSALGCAQPQTGTVVITVNELPTATIAGSTAVCQFAASPVITFEGNGGSSPYTFTYTINNGPNQTVTSTNNSSVTVSVPTATVGTFTYELISVEEGSVYGCSQGQTGTQSVIVNPLPTATITGTTAVCEGGVAPVLTFTGDNGTAPYTFTYNINGGANQTVTTTGGSSSVTVSAPTTTSGTFTYNLVSVQDGSPTTCSQNQVGAAAVTVNPLPTATITGTADVCINGESPLITFIGANGTAPYTFTYNVNGAGNQTVTTTGGSGSVTVSVPTGVTGTYTYNLVSVQDASSTACSQAQTGSTSVTVHDLPNVFAGNDLTVCAGQTAVLTASGAQTYAWNNGVTNGVPFVPTQTTTYTVVGTSQYGCVNTDEVEVTVIPIPEASFTGDNLIGCSPVAPTFTNTSTGDLQNCVWSFSNGQTLTGCNSVSTTFTTPGCYDVSLTVTTPEGCSNTTTAVNYVCVEPDPVAGFTANPTELSTIDPTSQFINTSTGASTYTWSFGDGSQSSNELSPSHTYPLTAGNYVVSLIAYSPAGCIDSTSRVITVREELIFYVPNAFTPDNDQYNEIFKPIFTQGFDPFNYNLLIFNRWGEVLFESNDAEFGWNGTYGGKIVQDGVYIWKITFKRSGVDDREQHVGHVTLIR